MEKIISNCDALEAIFRYLDIEEHLKLVQVCPQFEYAIVHGVWRLMYKNLRLSRPLCEGLFLLFNAENNIFTGTFLLQYNAVNDVMTECSLTPEQIHIILKHSSMYIQKLELNRIRRLENIISFNYHRLTELTLCDIDLEDTHLQQVARNCLNLQSLSLKRFSKSKQQANIRTNVFSEMKSLTKLEISDITFAAWNYFDVQQLLSLAHLKTLIININIRDRNNNKGSNNNSTDRVYNIQNLTIGALPYLQSGNVCLIDDVKRFENLTKLWITSNECPTLTLYDNDLTQINNACPKLCELSFTNFYFSFKEFPRMNNLMHLTFERCRNMKLKHFDEIFRKLKLKSLSIEVCLVIDEAENISDYNYISNTLETLTIRESFDGNIYSTFFNRQHKFENVSKVRLGIYELGAQSTRLCFSHNFPYLQELIMDSFYISSEDILNLKHLKVLEFRLFDNMSWSYLEILFKHPALTHITITPCFWRVMEVYYDRSPICCEGLTTTLEYLSLSSVVYDSALHFWPSFRQRNKLLKLEIYDCDTSLESLV